MRTVIFKSPEPGLGLVQLFREMTLNRCVLDSVVNLDFNGLFSAMLQEAFHSILRFFSYIKIKHLIEPVSK